MLAFDPAAAGMRMGARFLEQDGLMCWLTILFLALVFPGCSSDWIRASSIRPAVALVTRDYDRYVAADEELSDVDRDARRQTARMLRHLVDRAASGRVQ